MRLEISTNSFSQWENSFVNLLMNQIKVHEIPLLNSTSLCKLDWLWLEQFYHEKRF